MSVTLQFLVMLAAYIDQSFSLWSRCKTGKHTAVKQVIAPVKKNTTPSPTVVSSTNASSKDSCSRCRQGFFCSEHGIHMLLLMALSQVLSFTNPPCHAFKANFLSPIPLSSLGSQSKPVSIVDKSPNLVGDASAVNNSNVQAPKPKKIVDINEPQTCKNKGCGQTFKEKDNHDTACSYHPGPAVFHDRMRGVSIEYSTECS